MKAKLLACCILIILSGCWANKSAEEISNGFVDEIHKSAEFSTVVFIYYGHNDKWPNSIEELKAFCSTSVEVCPDLNWSKYKDVSFQELPDGKLRIESKTSHEQKEASFSIVLATPNS